MTRPPLDQMTEQDLVEHRAHMTLEDRLTVRQRLLDEAGVTFPPLSDRAVDQLARIFLDTAAAAS